jgi:hypothetical protein
VSFLFAGENMPKKGTTFKQNMTDEKIEQRRQAPLKHGTYAIRDRGEAGMTNEQRGLYVELQEQLSTPAGVRQAMIEQAAQSLVLYRAATSYVSQQNKKGVPLDQIALLRAIPAFQNSAARQLAQLLAALPDDADVLNIQSVLEAVKDDTRD